MPHNTTAVCKSDTMHPALYSWREELPANFVRALAYVCAAFVLSIACAWLSQSSAVMSVITPVHRSAWIEIEKPFPAFALAIPEAIDAPSAYAIRRHASGEGRKDILSLGEADGVAPYLQVEVYRPGSELADFADPQSDLTALAKDAGPVSALHAQETLSSKFGPLNVAAFDVDGPTVRHCLGFVRDYEDPKLQLSGRFCQGGADTIDRSTLACALDRLTLLAAGSEPKVGALFARAELNRSFCGQRDPILAPTPKYKLLWQALANRPQPRRIGR
jgi:hypothetical protein